MSKLRFATPVHTIDSPGSIIDIPDYGLIVLIGAIGAGKTTFAETHFTESEIISPEHCRALASDIIEDIDQVMLTIAETRLKHRQLAVIDASNAHADQRKSWIKLARKQRASIIAIVLDPGVKTCIERNRQRPSIVPKPKIAISMTAQIRDSLHKLALEGFSHSYHLTSSPEVIDTATILRKPLSVDRRNETGGFDIIGDIHGCADELQLLIAKLGYVTTWTGKTVSIAAPHGRKLVFVGDLIDRGPRNADVLRIVMSAVKNNVAFAVAGNHDDKLYRYLLGHQVSIGAALQITLDQLANESAEFIGAVTSFLKDLPSHYWLDNGALAVCHAGIQEDMIGRDSPDVAFFTLYGETTGEVDELNFPVRRDWARDYEGSAHVVYGHTTIAEPKWIGKTICIDTGCVFGGKLTALSWPENIIHSIRAEKIHYTNEKRVQK